jgi:excinuclease ABC subunit C
MKEAASLCQYETAARYRDLITGLTIIMHGINGYQELSASKILLNIPVREGNILFFIYQGYILHKRFLTAMTPQEVDRFILESLELPATDNPDLSEKSSIDFRDTIYSEIMSLPEEMVRLLPSEA